MMRLWSVFFRRSDRTRLVRWWWRSVVLLTVMMVRLISSQAACPAYAATFDDLPCVDSQPEVLNPVTSGAYAGNTYFRAHDGFCCSKNGVKAAYIDNQAECQAIATLLGGSDTDANNVEWSDSAYGCISQPHFGDSPTTIVFNTVKSGYPCGSFTYSCWCKIVYEACDCAEVIPSDAEHTFSDYPNIIGDVCGTCGGTVTHPNNCGGLSIGGSTVSPAALCDTGFEAFGGTDDTRMKCDPGELVSDGNCGAESCTNDDRSICCFSPAACETGFQAFDGTNPDKTHCASSKVLSSGNCAREACDSEADLNTCCVTVAACDTAFEASDGSNPDKTKCADDRILSIGNCAQETCDSVADLNTCCVTPAACETGFELFGGTDSSNLKCNDGQVVSGGACALETCSNGDRSSCCVAPAACSTVFQGPDGTHPEKISCPAGSVLSSGNCAEEICSSVTDASACCVAPAACDTVFEASDGTNPDKTQCDDGKVLSGGNCAGDTCDSVTDINACCVAPATCGSFFQSFGGTDSSRIQCNDGEVVSDGNCAAEDCENSDRSSCCVAPARCSTAFQASDGANPDKTNCASSKVLSSGNCARETCDRVTDASACCVAPAACDTVFEASDGTNPDKTQCGDDEVLSGGNCAGDTCDSVRDINACCVAPAACSSGFETFEDTRTDRMQCAEELVVSDANCEGLTCDGSDVDVCCVAPPTITPDSIAAELTFDFDTDRCADDLLVLYKRALVKTISTVTGVSRSRITNVTLEGGMCARGRGRRVQTEDTVNLYGKYTLRFIVIPDSSRTAERIDTLLKASLVPENSNVTNVTQGEVANPTVPFVDVMVSKMAASQSCNDVEPFSFTWKKSLLVMEGVVYFPFDSEIGSPSVATSVELVLEKQNILNAAYHCEMYSGIYLALCDKNSSASIIIDIAVADGIVIAPVDSNETLATADDGSSDAMSLVVPLIAAGGSIFILCAGVLAVLMFFRVLGFRMRDEENILSSTKRMLKEFSDDNVLLEQGWLLQPSEVKLGRKLGVGAAGEVWKAVLRDSMNVAVKIVKDSKNETDMMRDKEVSFMRRCRHPRLTLFLGHGRLENGNIFMVLEYMDAGGMDAHLWHRKSNPPPWFDRVQWLIDVAEAMVYLHNAMKCCHRDLKSPNVLLSRHHETGSVRAKVSDFGMSKLVTKAKRAEYKEKRGVMRFGKKIRTRFGGIVRNEEFHSRETQDRVIERDASSSSSADRQYWTSQVGTLEWLPPELMEATEKFTDEGHLLKRTKYDDTVDQYAFGCVMYEVLELRPPWSHSEKFKWAVNLYDAVMAGKRPPVRSNAPSGYIHLMGDCWSQNSSDRPPFTRVVKSLREMHDLTSNDIARPSHSLILGGARSARSTAASSIVKGIKVAAAADAATKH